MPSCLVKCCKNNSTSLKKCQGITYHRFPTANQSWKNDWVKIIRNCRGEDQWVPSKTSVICSIHFDANDLYTTKNGLRRVVTYAVPKRLLFEPPNIEEQSVEPGMTFPLQISQQLSSHHTSITCLPSPSSSLTQHLPTVTADIQQPSSSETSNSLSFSLSSSQEPCASTLHLLSEIPSGAVIIARVYKYLQKEYEELKARSGDAPALSSLGDILRRTAAATGLSRRDVSAVLEADALKPCQGKREAKAEVGERKRLKYNSEDEDVSPIEKESDDDDGDSATQEEPCVEDNGEDDLIETLKVEYYEDDDYDEYAQTSAGEQISRSQEIGSSEVSSAIENLIASTVAKTQVTAVPITDTPHAVKEEIPDDVYRLSPRYHGC